MCGFAGFVAFGQQRLDVTQRREILHNMGRAIAHRGPDDEQFYDDGILSLVFRRLGIVDLGGGKQPIFSADGEQLVVVNGEIYNHQALRQSLGGRATFNTHSDSEVPLHLLALEGAPGLVQLRGMFALAHWNRRTHTLLLARDRLGIKPLYVVQLSDGLLFGSELKALLLHPQCPRKLDWTALDITPAQMRSPVASYVEGVAHLPAGHFLSASATGTRTQAYWCIDDYLGTAPFGQDAAAYSREYQRLLEESTAEHLLGDVPIGIHLSGGLDSSLIAGIAAKKTQQLACYSMVERGSFRAGDVEAARFLTASLELEWHPVLFDFRHLSEALDFDLAAFEQTVSMMDSPRFDVEWIFKQALHRVAKQVNPDMKVILLGQGADEFAGGYSRRIDRPRLDWASYIAEEVEPNTSFYDALARNTPMALCGMRRPASVAASTTASPTGRHLGPYHRLMSRLTYQLQHFNLWHEDRTSMANGVEARVPFLDHRLVELLASVPAQLHPTLFWNKQIIRDAAKHHIPDFDHRRLKLPFINNGDSRSVDIIVHGMASRIAPAFLQKYADSTDFPLDAQVIRALAQSVIERRGNFYHDAWRLLECMAIGVFAQQCASAQITNYRAPQAPGLSVITDSQWPEICVLFSAEPMLPAGHWQLSDRIGIPPNAEILQPVKVGKLNQQQRYLMCSEGMLNAEITLAISPCWLSHFLRNIGKTETAEFTIADWLDEYDLTLASFGEGLDGLYQAGFIRKMID
jgi:asparagine synthase (glutamine-hydrolysing)